MNAEPSTVSTYFYRRGSLGGSPEKVHAAPPQLSEVEAARRKTPGAYRTLLFPAFHFVMLPSESTQNMRYLSCTAPPPDVQITCEFQT